MPRPSAVPPLLGSRVPKLSLHDPGSVVLNRNHPVVDEPFGLAVPLRMARLKANDVAAPVVTVGLSRVVNCMTAPNEVPSAFVAIAQ